MAPRLTLADRRLLRNPPTPKTWLCQRRPSHEGLCDTANSAKYSACWLCGGAKPARPKLLWPLYEAACKKAGIEPGTRWPLAVNQPETVAKKTRRKGR